MIGPVPERDLELDNNIKLDKKHKVYAIDMFFWDTLQKKQDLIIIIVNNKIQFNLYDCS